MYKCYECGCIFNEGEQVEWVENLREDGYYSVYEKSSGCPECRGEYGETVTCSICGEEFLECELYGGVCDSCINKGKDFDVAFKVGAIEKSTIKLNSMLCYFFDEEEIEEILLRELKADCPNPAEALTDYISLEKEWFAENLSKVIEEENETK